MPRGPSIDPSKASPPTAKGHPSGPLRGPPNMDFQNMSSEMVKSRQISPLVAWDWVQYRSLKQELVATVKIGPANPNCRKIPAKGATKKGRLTTFDQVFYDCI